MSEQEVELTEEEQLRRFIARMSFIGMGLDDDLDQQLRGLRQAIKRNEDISVIREYVDDIADQLRKMEEHIEDAKQDHSQVAEVLISNLAQGIANLDPSGELEEQLTALTTRLKSDTPEAVITELITIVDEFIKDIRGNSKDVANSGVPTSLLVALDDFVSQLSVVDFYKPAAQRIREAIGHLNSIDQVARVIEQIASVLLEVVSQEHSEFENFLQTLNKRILNVASFLNHASVGQEGFIRDSEKLDEELRKTIGDIKQEINDTDGLGVLKQRLLGSFEHIFTSVSHFKEVQISRVNASISELKIVREQLEVTESETANLKETLKQQRIKAYTDPLTGLPNRYAYNERLNQECTRWKRYNSSLSLAVLDIDYFKQVNDKHGHTVGDSVLQEIANLVTNEMRESDFVARYGGEEFIILMPETNLAEAIKAINKLRRTIRDHTINISDQLSLSVTISCGVAQFEKNDDSHDVFQKADKALYRAKDKGRNQVCAERSAKVVR